MTKHTENIVHQVGFIYKTLCLITFLNLTSVQFYFAGVLRKFRFSHRGPAYAEFEGHQIVGRESIFSIFYCPLHVLLKIVSFLNLMAGILIIYHSPVRPVKVKILKVTL